MKPKFRSLIAAFAPLTHTSLIVCTSLCAVSNIHAADQKWTGATDDLWTTAGNWNAAIPGTGDVAVFDNTSAANLATTLGVDSSIQGLKVVDPAGAVSVAAGSTLTLGSAGIDMSAATQDVTLGNGVTLLGSTNQAWSVAAGRTLNLTGAFTRPAGGTLDVTNLGTINIAGLTATTGYNYGVYGGTDYLALDASKNAAPAASVVLYTANPSTGAALPSTSTGGTWYDVINSNTNGTTAFRLSSNMTATNIRFNTAHTNNQNWAVDINSRNLTCSSVLVTQTVGARNVQFNSAASGNGSFRMGGGAELQLHQYNTLGDLVINAQISQASAGANVTKDGPGRVIFALDSTGGYSGVTRVLEGTLQIGNGGATGNLNSASTVTNEGVLAFNRNNALNFVNAISGTGQVTVAMTGSSGVLTLSGTNSYTGATNFNAGTLALTDVNDLGGSTALNFNGGILQWSGITTDVSTSFNLTFNTGGAGFDTNGNDVTFSSPVGNSGTGGLVKSGAGKLTLAANNPFSGNSTVAAGNLAVANTTGSATGSGAVAVSSGAILSGTGIVSGTVSVASGGAVQPGASVGEITVGGLSLVTGSAVNVEFGAGNDLIDVTSSNGLTINGGTFNLYQDGTLTPFTTPGTYDLISFLGTVQGTGVPSLVVGNAQPGFDYTFAVVGNMVRLTIAPGGLISKWIEDGGGNWTDAPSWSSTVPGAMGDSALFDTNLLGGPATILLNASRTVGSLVFQSAANSYTLAPGTGGSLVFNNDTDDSVLSVLAGVHFVTAPVSFTSDLSVITSTSSESVTLSGGVSGVGNLAMNGAGTLILGGTNTANGGINLNNGTVEFGSASLGSNSLAFDGGRLRWAAGNTNDISSAAVTFGVEGAILDTNGNNVVLANPVGNSGLGSLVKEGSGSLELALTNSYSGSTSILGGSLVVADDAALGTDPGAPTAGSLVIGNGTLTVPTGLILSENRGITLSNSASSISLGSGATLTYAGTIAGSGTLNVSGSGGILNLTGVKSYTGGTVVTDATVQSNTDLPSNITLEGTGTLSFTGTRTVTGLTINGANTAINMNSGGVILTISTISGGSGQVTLTNTFVTDFTNSWGTFSGTIKLNGGGYRFNGTGGNSSATFDMNGFGASVRNGSTAISLGALTGPAGSTLGGPSNSGQTVTYTVGGNDASTTFAGVINNGNVAVNPTAKVALTKVGTGTLTLSGLNTFTGDTLVNDGGLVLGAGGQLTFRPGAINISNKLGGNGTGTATLNGAFNIDLTTAEQADGNSWLILDTSGFSEAPTFGVTFDVPGFTKVLAEPTKWVKVDGANKWTFDQTTGELVMSLSGYAGWIGGFGLTGPDAEQDFDYDQDGIENGIEFVIGGNPTTNLDADKIPTIAKIPGGFQFVFRRTDLSAASNPRAERVANLVGPWIPAVHDGVNVIITEEDNFFSVDPGIDRVTVQILTSDPRHFVRLAFDNNP